VQPPWPESVENKSVTNKVLSFLLLVGFVNAAGQYLNDVCVTRTFAKACWILRDFKDRCEDNKVEGGTSFFFLICPCFYKAILYKANFHKNATVALYRN